MDITLIVYDEKTKELSFAGAYNPLYIQRNGDIEILKADRMPVGKYLLDDKPFTIKNTTLNSGDRLYLFTDGYKDQTGGEKNKKFSSKKFRELLLETGKFQIKEQQLIINENFDQWKLDNEQIDDVLVVGVEV
jgi:serine phosphatase RsbU (regulator of sigma subunit)